MSTRFTASLLSIAWAFSALLALSEDDQPLREWQDKTGSFSVQARYVGSDGEQVAIEKSDGKVLKVPLASLSANDVDYVNRILYPEPSAAKVAGTWGGKWEDSELAFLVITAGEGDALSLVLYERLGESENLREEKQSGKMMDGFFRTQTLIFRQFDDHLLAFRASGQPRAARMIRLDITPDRFTTIDLEDYGWVEGVEPGNHTRAIIIDPESTVKE